MSDLHLDFDYTPGMSNNCGKPLCCRSDSGEPKNQDEISGLWGDYNCDTPVKTLMSMFKHIREEIKPDIILWGGDSIAHNVDTLSLKENV